MKQVLSIESLIKAVSSLKEGLAQPYNEFTRDAVIQRFEYSFELCWKTLRRYLSEFTGIKEFQLKKYFSGSRKARFDR